MADHSPKTLEDIPDDKLNPQILRMKRAHKVIRALLLRGVKDIEEIQTQLGKQNPPINVSMRTTFRYMADLRKEMELAIANKEGLKQSVEEMAYTLIQVFEEVSRELWKQYHAPTKVSARGECQHCKKDTVLEFSIPGYSLIKVAALKEIRTTAEKQVEKLQSLGLAHKAPEKHQMLDANGNPIDPAELNKQALNQQFISFIKATFQNPVGLNKPDMDKPAVEQKAQVLPDAVRLSPVPQNP